MSTLDILLLGVGVSADAFAVAISKGLCMNRFDKKYATKLALMFGFFQGMMTFIGYYLGFSFIELIKDIDHWIAFTLLAFLGYKMIFEAVKSKEEDLICPVQEEFRFKEALVLSIATSIDALAVGISLAAIRVQIIKPSIIIGIMTFGFSRIAVKLGYKFGAKYKKGSEIMGGAILVIIAIKILLEHLLG
ncbi:MAG: manganese efflux pump MntP family protein [Lagierella massiliensis]|nr:manganese efflux pump MntP family protein [Lagierella massiliensis]